MMPQEVKVWNWLRELPPEWGYHFRRQVRIGPYVADFACLRPKIVVEIDGHSHGSDAARVADADRDRYLAEQGFKVLRFWNAEIGRGGQDFVDYFTAKLSGEDKP